MITAGILSTILGAFTASLPSIIGIFEKRQDHKYEVELERIRMDAAKQGVDLQIALQEAKASVEEGDSLRRHDMSLSNDGFVGSLRASVRPVITYLFFLMFCLIKGSAVYVMIKQGADIPTTLAAIWDGETVAIFGAIIGFWFGGRAIEKYNSRSRGN